MAMCLPCLVGKEASTDDLMWTRRTFRGEVRRRHRASWYRMPCSETSTCIYAFGISRGTTIHHSHRKNTRLVRAAREGEAASKDRSLVIVINDSLNRIRGAGGDMAGTPCATPNLLSGTRRVD